MIDMNDQLSITKQCTLLDINRSSFYYSPKTESKENLEIMETMDKLYNSMTTDWCNACIKEAIEKHGVPEIINSDQGSQFTSAEYVALLNDNGIKISMDGKGRYRDNIFIERLWRSVIYENIYLYAYEDGLSLWKGLNEYFDFYNEERFHESLDYQTPYQVYYKDVA